jgi:hypothetical protein
MKTLIRTPLVIVTALLVLLGGAAPLLPAASAAPPNFPAIGSMVFPIVLHLTGAWTATKTNAGAFIAPFNARILYATASASTKAGTHINSHGRTHVRLVNDSNIVTQGPEKIAGHFTGLAVASPNVGVPSETNAAAASGTAMAPSTQNVTSGKTLSVDMVVWGGGGQSISDITVVVWLQRRG